MRKMSLTFAVFAFLASSQLAWSQSEVVSGEVKKIDEAAGKITIKHGPIKKFDMEDGMTMVYRVQDPAMLKTVKPGDKVKFDADQIDGQFTVMKIQKKN